MNVTNGAKMKKFKKPERGKNKDKEDVSSMVYWYSKEGQCNLISASWDGVLRLFDDNNSEREGQYRQAVGRHNGQVNFVDFNDEQSISASASDDGEIHMHNHTSHRAEGNLTSHPDNRPEVKICKFLPGHDCLVSADVDGYLNFFATPPHPLKTKCLLKRREINNEEQLQLTKSESSSSRNIVYYTIRGMDFDAEEQVLYTGDEIGYIQKWDLKKFLRKLKDQREDFEEQ